MQVKKDKHGLFVMIRGMYARPTPSKYHPKSKPVETRCVEGDGLKGRVLAGPELVEIRGEGLRELWFIHGTYAGKNPTSKSEDAYTPLVPQDLSS